VIDRKGILQKDGWVLDHPLTTVDLEKVVLPLLQLLPSGKDSTK
jgi:hypothetical protein